MQEINRLITPSSSIYLSLLEFAIEFKCSLNKKDGLNCLAWKVHKCPSHFIRVIIEVTMVLNVPLFISFQTNTKTRTDLI